MDSGFSSDTRGSRAGQLTQCDRPQIFGQNQQGCVCKIHREVGVLPHQLGNSRQMGAVAGLRQRSSKAIEQYAAAEGVGPAGRVLFDPNAWSGMKEVSTDDIILCVQSDPGIETLLDLNGQIMDQGNGYWIKIEAYRVAPTGEIPHGIRYCLTLHEPYGKRILGYDNAHSVKLPQKFKYAGRRLTFDHKHRHATDHGVPYEFKDAHQLLADFFVEVDRVLSEVRKQ